MDPHNFEVPVEKPRWQCDGEKVGQVNGFSVYSVGDALFGRPSRITASTFLGRSGAINIEREAELSGPTHSKEDRVAPNAAN